MKITETELPGVFILEPKVWEDPRGYFFESYRDDLFTNTIRKVQWVQDNESRSAKGVLRGLHYQTPPFAQSKLVRVIEGSVLDVVVDIRKGSPHFGKHLTVELNQTNKKQIFVPRGFAHGFLVLSETAVFCYKVDNYYSKECDRSIQWNDPAIGVDWRLPASELQLSAKDMSAKPLAEADLFSYGIELYA